MRFHHELFILTKLDNFKRFIMDDHFVLGVGNSSHPANQQETELELTIEEKMENEICDLERKIQELRIRIKYREAVNKKIVELCQAVCGDNTYIFNKLKEIK